MNGPSLQGVVYSASYMSVPFELTSIQSIINQLAIICRSSSSKGTSPPPPSLHRIARVYIKSPNGCTLYINLLSACEHIYFTCGHLHCVFIISHRHVYRGDETSAKSNINDSKREHNIRLLELSVSMGFVYTIALKKLFKKK